MTMEKAVNTDQLAQTMEEKIWVVNTLLKHKVAKENCLPVEDIHHDIRLGLIGREGEFVKADGFNAMTLLFAELKISNIHIRHVLTQQPCDNDSAGPYAFTLSDVLTWFIQEVKDVDDLEKIKLSQALGMFLVFMVKDSFMENFSGGVKLAGDFLHILSGLPGLERIRSPIQNSPVVSMVSSGDVSRYLFDYVSGKTSLPPDDEIAFILLKNNDCILFTLDEIMSHFESHPDGDNDIGVACHFVPYVITDAPAAGMIRLSDMIVTVAALMPEEGEKWTSVADNMMGLLYHICNSNLKGVDPITATELQERLLTCKRYMTEQVNKA